eukprot:2714156-Pyramimonas_sp.AAC.1
MPLRPLARGRSESRRPRTRSGRLRPGCRRPALAEAQRAVVHFETEAAKAEQAFRQAEAALRA